MMLTRNLLLIVLTMSIVGCGQPDADRNSTDVPPQAESYSGGDQAVSGIGSNKDSADEYAKMESALNLSAGEASSLKAAFEARDAEVASWMADRGSTLEGLEKKMSAAAKARDLAGVRAAKAQATPLRNELRELVSSHADAVLATLSVENQSAWAAHQLGERVLESMKPLGLSQEQKRQIQTDAVQAVHSTSNEPNPSAAGFLVLEKTAESEVLTADQRAAYDAEKKKNPMRSLR